MSCQGMRHRWRMVTSDRRTTLLKKKTIFGQLKFSFYEKFILSRMPKILKIVCYSQSEKQINF
jgi:hypothetical protein